MKVLKRDGSIQEFDPYKIQRALVLAFHDSGINLPNILPQILGDVVREPGDTVSVARLQTLVENRLMESGFPDVARQYIIYRHGRDLARAERLKPDPHALASYIHAAKYARNGEQHDDTVKRVIKMHKSRFGAVQEAPFWNPAVLPSMRSMQFAGPAIEKHNARMFNCSYTLVDRVRVFSDILYLLLCGCGCGFSVQWEHVLKLPRIRGFNKGAVAHYHIADSIEGWASAVKFLFNCAIRGVYPEFDYSYIRPAGTPLVTSGGLAPGHLGLKKALGSVFLILESASGRQLRPIECHDIICHLAEAVLSGGIRRSSLISIFSPSDTEMMYCKFPGSYDPGRGLNAQRALANNSVLMLERDASLFERVLELSVAGYGEPGFYFSHSRDAGPNPCGEIVLEPTDNGMTGFAFCNLTEVNVAACSDKDMFLAACADAAYIGTLQAAYTSLLDDGITNQIARRDSLLGVSLTGILDNTACLDWLAEGYARVKRISTVTASSIGIPPAKRLTCVKPSGTASLLLGGVASGCHPHHARRYFRRVTANPLEPVARLFRERNPHMVEVKPNGDWALVFPIQCSDQAITLKELSATEHIKIINRLYNSWADHAVSATVVVDDPRKIAGLILESGIRCLSFVPPTLDKLYPYAPRESVTTEKDEQYWNYLIREYRPVDYRGVSNDGYGLEPACAGGSCDV